MPDIDDDVLDDSADATLDDVIDEQDGKPDPDAEKDRADDEDDDEGEPKAKDDSDEEETEDKAKDKGDDEQPKSIGKRIDRRIGKLTREKNDARREADYWKSQADAIRTQPRQPAQQDDGNHPQLTAQDIETRATEIAENAIARREFLARRDSLTDKLETGGATKALARLSNSALTAFEVEAVEALAEAKFPVEVAKAIAGNEELFSQFAKCRNGVQRATMIARLDGRVEARREQRKQSDVKPNKQVRGSARSVDKHPDDMSQAEYEQYRKKQGWA